MGGIESHEFAHEFYPHPAGRLPMRSTAETPLSGPGISTAEPVDFDADGDLDLVLGAEPGVPMWAENVGSDREKRFTPPMRLKWAGGTAVETYSMELGDEPLLHPHRTWIDSVDYDGDGRLDLVALDSRSRNVTEDLVAAQSPDRAAGIWCPRLI
jgi:hypothetical protein